MKFTTSVCLSAVLVACQTVAAAPSYNSRPFDSALEKRQSTTSLGQAVVDLGYGLYTGVANSTTALTTWKGIRFAAPPTGVLRWQAPQPPVYNRSQVVLANAFGPQCPQSGISILGAAGIQSNEDCLFLNVYAPTNGANLPVLVWIHGGGYGLGNGQQDMTQIISTNNNSMIVVAIQYRLGAFGFLSSDEVYRNGVVNAGLLDQQFALQWVQAYIHIFGGNSSQVTIMGESAGAGSVMLQDIAYGGSLGDSLFRNTIAASPYLPMAWGYKDFVPSQSYYAFATHAGCPPAWAYGNSSESIFQCLIKQNTTTLQKASFAVSPSGVYGTWAFVPVVDGSFVQELPSQQLLKKKLNGKSLLVGNNANEGPLFTPMNITTENDLVAWLELTFPLFDNSDIAKILLYYPSTNASVNSMDPLFATTGYGPASALNQSQVATGQQQRADNIYSETTFVCPSYWMAEAYSDRGRSSYKYQYSVGGALHGSDVTGYFGPRAIAQGADFETAFMTIIGNFVKSSNPSISAAIANGANATNPQAVNPASTWPQFEIYAPYQLDLNQTGGMTVTELESFGFFNATELIGPGLRNNFSLVNAYTWEAGRGYRCDFWRSVAAIVPE